MDGVGGVREGKKRLLRWDLLFGLTDIGLGNMRSGGILSPKWRASFETRFRRWLISRSSLDFSHSAGKKSVDLEAEADMMEGGRFENEEIAGLGTWGET
jgi:hypothetical protein